MSSTKNTNRKLSSERAFVLLANYGRLLDLMEIGRIALVPHQYRKAAVFASKIIQEQFDKDFVKEVCASSPALNELRENLVIESAAAHGAQRWLIDLQTIGSRP